MDFWSIMCPVPWFFLGGLVAKQFQGHPNRTALTRRLKLQAGCCKASNAVIRHGIPCWNLEQLVTQTEGCFLVKWFEQWRL